MTWTEFDTSKWPKVGERVNATTKTARSGHIETIAIKGALPSKSGIGRFSGLFLCRLVIYWAGPAVRTYPVALCRATISGQSSGPQGGTW